MINTNTTIHIAQSKWSLLVEIPAHILISNEKNQEHSKFKVGDHVIISKYKNTSEKVYVPNWSEEVFVIMKVKNTVPRTYVIIILKGKKLIECFMKKNAKYKSKKHLG